MPVNEKVSISAKALEVKEDDIQIKFKNIFYF